MNHKPISIYERFGADKKRLISNFFSLSSVEAANYIFPLITLPYLVRVLGPEKFGLVAFAQAFIQYFVLLTDYGFNLSATRNVSIHRNNIEKVSRIFSSVILIKFCLMLLSFVILSALVFSIPKFRADWVLYYCCFGFVIGNILFPIWLFQGMERMKFIAFLNLIAKTIFLAAIFVFVKKQADYFYVPLLAAIGGITAGILSIGIAVKKFRVHLKPVSVADMTHELKEGWHIFISTAAISLYTTSNTFILGLVTNNTVVGYYSAAERLVRSGQRLLNPVTQSIYPYVSKVASESKKIALNFIRKALPIISLGSFAISVTIYLSAHFIVNIILGPNYAQSIVVLRILAFVPFIVATATVFATFFLLSFGYTKEWSKIIITCGFISLIFTFVFVYVFKMAHIGAALSWVGTECSVLILSYLDFRKYSHAYR